MSNFFSSIFNFFFYRPISSLFWVSFLLFKDLGISILFFAFCIKILLSPLSFQMLKNEKKFAKIKGEIEEINRKYQKDSKEKAQKLIEIYKRENFNPFLSFFSSFLQIPILYSVYRVLRESQNFHSVSFFGLIDLTKPNIFLAILVIFVQLFLFLKKKENYFVIFFSLLLLFLVLLPLPSSFSLFILASSLYGIFERILVLKRI